MSRIIKDRNNREFCPHVPIGVSACKRGSTLTIAELVKKTSVLERQKLIDNSPLYDEFKAGTPIESLDLLDYLDLGVQPLDLTDAAYLRNLAKEQMESNYKRWKEKNVSASTGGNGRQSEANNATP